MNTTRFITSFISSIILPVSIFAQGVLPIDPEHPNPKGLEMDKWVETSAEEGKYNLVLEAFVTGASNQTIQETHIPMDIVLVLDVSGSMDKNMSSYTYSPRGSQGYSYNGYGNSQYYYKDGDNYFLVSRSSEKIGDEYIALPSQSYSYNGFVNSQYFYKHTDGNYYQVTKDSFSIMGYPLGYYLKYNVGGITYYLSNGGSTIYPIGASSSYSANDTIWSGVLYTQSCYRLSYNKDGTTYYLTSDGPTTTAPTDVRSNTATIWTGVLYTRNSGSVKKIDALKSAVNNFIDVIAADADNNSVDHMISIVKFANHYTTNASNDEDKIYDSLLTEGDDIDKYKQNVTQVVKNLYVASESADALKAAVSGLRATGATFVDYGMKKATYVLNNNNPNYNKDGNRVRVVVMFTDGEPNHNSGFENDVANAAIKNALELKSKDVLVYSVGVFDNETEKIRNYMNRVSSNYPKAESLSDSTNPRTDGKNFYMKATNADELRNIFKVIAEASIQGAADIKDLVASSTTVIDILGTDFTLPAGTNADDIIVQTIEATDGEGTKENPFIFDSTPQTFAADVSITTKDGKEKITVTNYDFSKDDTWTDDKSAISSYGNWVGPREWGSPKKTEVKGQKLRITIPIELKPGYSGGYVDCTNTPDSGIYIEGQDTPKGRFPVPYLDYPSIAIVKTGLNEGESAVFEVTRPDGKKSKVILTGEKSGGDVYTFIKNIPEGSYTVEELSSWSWAYTDVTSYPDDANSLTKDLNEETAEDYVAGVKCLKFTFNNQSKGSIPDHAEAIVTNDFRTSGNGTTVTSKPQPTN